MGKGGVSITTGTPFTTEFAVPSSTVLPPLGLAEKNADEEETIEEKCNFDTESDASDDDDSSQQSDEDQRDFNETDERTKRSSRATAGKKRKSSWYDYS